MSCSLCAADASRQAYAVPGGPAGAEQEASALLCQTCISQIDGELEADHWRCLASSMWSEDPATQVLAARLLVRLNDHDWARDLSEQLWLDDDMRAWVDAAPEQSAHKDSNGVSLQQGDTVVLIKDLPVKGAGFTAKRGTAVRGISLVAENAEHIEGRVDGQRIVILTKYVKKK